MSFSMDWWANCNILSTGGYQPKEINSGFSDFKCLRSRWHIKNQTAEDSTSNAKALCSWGLSTAGHSSRLRNDGILRLKPSQSYGQSSEHTHCSSPQQDILHLAAHFYDICKKKSYSSGKFATTNWKIIGQNPLRNRTKPNHSKNYSSVFQIFRWLTVTSLSWC